MADDTPRIPNPAKTWSSPLTATREAVLPGGSDAELRRLIYGIFTMSVRFDRLREAMAGCLGLTGIQYHILMVVAERDADNAASAPATISTIAETLHASGAYVTTEAGKLVARGLLAKHPNPADGRSVVLRPTEAGRALIDGFADDLRAVNDALFDEIGPETFERFGAIVAHMVGTSERAVDLIETIARDRQREDGGDRAAVGR